MIILVATIAMLSGRHHPHQGEITEIFVRANPHISVESIASTLHSIGKVKSRTKGTSVFLVEVDPKLDEDEARERIGRIKGLTALEPEDEPVDMKSVSSLSRKIAHLTKDEAEERREGKHKKDEKEKAGVDYLKALQYFTARRAYPKDTVDWSAYSRATTHVSQMLPANKPRPGIVGRPSLSSQNWSFFGPTNLSVPYSQYYGISPVNGRVNAVAFDPNNSTTIYAGGAQGGLWKSTNAGANWTWLSASWAHLGINCIVIDPVNTNTIYVGLGDYHGQLGGSVGMMKSTDGGMTWAEVATAAMGQIGVDRILIDPTNNLTILAGTGDINGFGELWLSTNGGIAWKLVNSIGQSYWPALAASAPVGQTTRFYAVAAGIGENTSGSPPPYRTYKSDDHGTTWQLLTSPVTVDGTAHLAYGVTTSPTNPNTVYILDSEHDAIYESTNQGTNWSNITANFPTGNLIQKNYNWSQNFYDYHIECGSRTVGSTTSDVLYVGEIDIVETADGGASWQSIGGPTYAAAFAQSHNDQHCLEVCPTNPDLAIFSNDGGVYEVLYSSSTNSNSIANLNQFLGNSMFYYIAMHPTIANFMLGGTQDNASPFLAGDPNNWENVGGGDGGGSAINQTNPQIEYTTLDGFIFYRTSDAWNRTSVDISPNTGNDPVPFVATVTLAPTNQYLMYSGTDYLYRYTDTTGAWTSHVGGQRLTASASGQIDAIEIAPTDATRIYTGSSDGQVWMSTNSGTSWKQLNTGTTALPNLAITWISVSPTNSSDILVGLSGTGSPHLWRCANTQATPPVFTSVSSTGTNALPDLSLNVIARDLDNPTTTWYVGTDIGVFSSSDSGVTWQNAGAPLGLPNVIVTDLRAVPGTRFLNAGTYGSGMWRLLLPAAGPQVSGLTLSSTTVREGNSVTGTVTLNAAAPTGGIDVQLTSSDSTAAPTPLEITIPAGLTSATFSITTPNNLPAAVSPVISANYNGETVSQTLSITTGTISGTITFGDYTGTPPSSVVLNFRMAGQTAPFTTMTVSVDPFGNFTALNAPAEAYTVYIQTGTWLRRSISLNLTSSDALGTNYTLINGDVNGDNRIDINDLRLVTAAQGSTPTSKNWNPNADLNGDGVVNGADLDIVYKNYGKLGDK